MKEVKAMRKPISLIFMLTIFLMNTGSPFATDLEDGFFDVQWKTNLSQVSGFKQVGKNLSVTYFANPARIYTIDTIKIPDVVYGSYANQFFAVYINIETIEVFSQLKRHFNKKYGVPKISMGTPEQQTTYQWKHQKTKIKLKTYADRNRMKMALYYMPLSRQVNEAQQEAYHENFKNPMFPLNKRREQEAIDFLETERSTIGRP